MKRMEQITVYAGIYTTWSKTGSISNAFHVSYGDPLFEWDEQWIFPLCLHASVGIILSSGCVKKNLFPSSLLLMQLFDIQN